MGIAGYGVIGKIRHKFCDLHQGLRVIGLCDVAFHNDETSIPGIKKFNKPEQLLELPLDVLFVCLPNYLAAKTTIMGLKNGLHVFCEKPPGRSLSDLRDVIAVENKHPNQRLMYGFNHRFHDSVKDAMEIISSQRLGDVVDLRGVYGKSKIIKFDSSEWRTQRNKAGGGILLDQGIHMVDMMRMFAGEFTSVHSFVKNEFWGHDVEDNAYALMQTSTGKVAILHSSATQWRHRFQLDITLTKGALVLSGILSNSRSYGAETITIVYAEDDGNGDPKEETIRYNKDNSWADEIRTFFDLIEKGHKVEASSSSDALKTMELVFKIYDADPSWKDKVRNNDFL